MSQPVRVVIDPNVYVSAAITPHGTCGQLIDAMDDSDVTAVTCPHLLDELQQVLLRPKLRRYIVPDEVPEYCATIRARSEPFPDPVETAALTDDPKDDYLIALACDAEVTAVVSGDPDLLDADVPVPVWSPRMTLDRLRPG